MDKLPYIFISHDSRDEELAELFSKLLKVVSVGVLQSFRSSDKRGQEGIPVGAEWFKVIMEKVQQSTDVVCLLTRRSFDKPWILYEAGLARGFGNIDVHGVTFDLNFNELRNTPFANFQNTAVDEASLSKLLLQLLKRIPGARPEQEDVVVHVKQFMARAREIMKGTRKRSTDEILEHIEDLLETRGAETFYVGRYPDFFEKQVCQLLLEAREKILIACDYPAYGFVTNPKLYERYRAIVHQQANALLPSMGGTDASAARFQMIVPTEKVRAELIKGPFPPNEADYRAIVNDGRYTEGIKNLEKYCDRVISNLATFYEAVITVNAKEKAALPVFCREVDRRMPIFVWIADGRHAAFAIPTYLQGDNSIEHAFSTRDQGLVRALESIVINY